MTDAINPNNSPNGKAINTDTRTTNGAKGQQSRATSSDRGGHSNPATIVELSNPGLLQNIGEKIDKLPEVNEARVASVKQSLIQGNYQPDAEVIARKFSEIEKLLP